MVLHLHRDHLRHISYIIGHTDRNCGIEIGESQGQDVLYGIVLVVVVPCNKIAANTNADLQNIVNNVTKLTNKVTISEPNTNSHAFRPC